jgi:PhzF family phenazine biosynthesis protein
VGQVIKSRAFAQVDVFASERYRGNPVAVVLDGDGVDDEAMRQFASWTNLSETTFVVPPVSPEADYGLRIFTPGGELPFAGHPTLGSAHAWLEAGGTPASGDVIVQECPLGLVKLRRTGEGLSFRAPELLREGPLDEELLGRIARGLRVAREDIVSHRLVDNGPGWTVVELASARRVLDLEPDDAHMGDLKVGVFGRYPAGSPHLLEVRAFVAPVGIREDPVTGSLNAGLAQWLIGTGAAPAEYTASQGTRLGRRGVVTLRGYEGEVWVGGVSLTCIRGTVDL